MDTQQHNDLIKVCFDGSKHLKHVLSLEEINRMTMVEQRFPLTKLPVCGGCERLAMWSKGMQATCTYCGTITKCPVTYATYLASGFDVDTTGATAKSVMQSSESMRDKILPQYEKVQELIIAGR